MEKLKLPPDQYDRAVEAYREKYHYDIMSREEQEQFDDKLNQVVECSDKDGDVRPPDHLSDSAQLREEMKKKYRYNEMSDQQKEEFDAKLDEVIGPEEESEGDDSDGEVGPKVRSLERTRRR